MKDLGTRLVLYETGNLPERQTVALFQDMIDIGVVWDNPDYNLMAKSLICAGLCHEPRSYKMLTVEEFIALEKERIERFAMAYNAGHEREPDNFPAKLAEEDFLRQYEAWLEYIYQPDPELNASNENNETKNSS